MTKKNEHAEKKADRREKGYGDLEDLFSGWERFNEQELFDELAKRSRAYLRAYEEWVKQFQPNRP